jgi:hypothetical protein
MIRSVPTCETDVTLRVFRYFRRRSTKGVGAAAVVRENWVRWQRKPESIIICCLFSGLENFMRKILEERS